MKRYELGSPQMGGSMEEHEDGDYVLYETAADLLAAEHRANAAHIVRCVNARDELLAAVLRLRESNRALRDAIDEAVELGKDKMPVRAWAEVSRASLIGWQATDAAIARATGAAA